jgi:hypothetical protein
LSRLQFPRHLYFLGATYLARYALASRATSQLAALPATDGEGRSAVPLQLVHSSRRSVWLVFCSLSGGVGASVAGGGPGAGKKAAGGPAAGWAWCLLREATLGYSDAAGVSLRPGAARGRTRASLLKGLR